MADAKFPEYKTASTASLVPLLRACSSRESRLRSAGEAEVNGLRVGAAIVIFTLLFVPSVAYADRNSCPGAAQAYLSALDERETKLRRYTSCVESADISEDCSSEFRRLKNAQAILEQAIQNHRSECAGL